MSTQQYTNNPIDTFIYLYCDKRLVEALHTYTDGYNKTSYTVENQIRAQLLFQLESALNNVFYTKFTNIIKWI